MPKNPAAVALGRRGGRAKSAKKADAARANGAKGGRPLTFAADCGHLVSKKDFWQHTFNGRTACKECADRV